MADVNHKNLTGTNIHEPKGLSTVSASNYVYFSDGAGGGAWAAPDITNISSGSTPADYVFIADGSGGTDWAPGGGAIYGELQVATNSTAQTLTLSADLDVDTNYVRVNATSLWSDGESEGVTLDATNAFMTIATAGLYEVSFWASFENDTNSSLTAFKYSIDDTTSNLSTRRLTRKTGTGGDIGSIAASGFVNLIVGAKLSLWVAASAACDVTIVDGGVTVTLLKAA